MGEIVEYATTTIPFDSLPSLLQINGEFPANGFVTPTAYTTQDGETILILPQFSTLVVTGDNADAVPIQQIVSGPFTVQPENGSAITITQDPNGDSFVVTGDGEQSRPTVLTIGDLSKKQLTDITSGNVIILPSNEVGTSQLQIVEPQQFQISSAHALAEAEIENFLHEDGRYYCDRCTSNFDRPRQLKRHIEEHKREKPLKCKSCTACFNVERNLILHEASHDLTPNSSCPICDKRFLRIAGLVSHLRIHQVDDTVSCELCKSEFDLQSELEEHLISMHSDHSRIQLKIRQSYDCRQCNVVFSDVLQYRKHIAEHRAIERSVRPIQPRRNRKKQSQEAIPDKASLKSAGASSELIDNSDIPQSTMELGSSALAVDVPEDPVVSAKKGRKHENKCSQCGKTFRTKMLLDRHILIHTGERPFACDQCDKSFNQKSALTLHKLCHTGEKPHHCQFCFASFSQRGNLRAHIKSCHRVPQDISVPNVYRCQICSCTFRRLSTYNAHLTLRHLDPASAPTAAANIQPTQRKRQRIILPPKPSTTTTVTQASLDLADQPPVVRISTSNMQLSHETNATQGQTSTSAQTVNGDDSVTITTLPSDQLIYTYLPVENSAGVVGSDELPPYDAVQAQMDIPAQSNVEVIEESYENVAVVDPDTNSVQHHRVTRVNGVLFHCCSFCEKRFRKTNDFVRHMRIHTLEKPFSCDICGNRFTNKSTLNTHMRVHAGPAAKRFRCHVCRKMFASPSSLKVHLRVHTGSRPFACSFCDKKFRTSSHRQDHMLKHQKNKQVIQQRVIAQQQQQHQRAAGEPLPGVQHFFLQNITSQSQEQAVIFTSNNNESTTEELALSSAPNNAPSSIDPVRKYACQHCPKAYKKSDHLRYHLESAHGSGQRSFVCQVCGKAFAMFAVLRNHIRTHAKHDLAGGNRPQQGDMNGGLSSYERSLLQHASLRTQQASDIVEQVTESARFELVSMPSTSYQAHQQQQLMPTSPNMVSRIDGMPTTNDLDDFNSITGDHLCFHCGRSFPTDELVRAHVNLEHQDAMPRMVEDARQRQGEDDERRIATIIECGDQGNAIVVQPWIPAADVLPELSLSLLQPPSVSVAGNGQTVGGDSLLVEHSASQEASSSPVLQHFQSAGLSREEDGPGLLEQLAARQECPTVIIAGNMQLQQQASMIAPNSPIIRSTVTGKTTLRSRGIPRGVTAHYHAETASFEFRCTLCGAVFYTKQSMSRHMKDMHSNKSDFTCSTCHRQLSSANALLLHSARCVNKNQPQQVLTSTDVHSAELASSSIQANEQTDEIDSASAQATSTAAVDSSKPHACKCCSRSFSKPSDLTRHERTHTGDRPFRCEQCGRSFRLKSALVGHQLTHLPTDERATFTCHLCKARLGSRTSLVVHLRRHTGVSPYHCPQCSEKFATASRRQTHILNAHINPTQNNNNNNAQVDAPSPQQ